MASLGAHKDTLTQYGAWERWIWSRERERKREGENLVSVCLRFLLRREEAKIAETVERLECVIKDRRRLLGDLKVRTEMWSSGFETFFASYPTFPLVFFFFFSYFWIFLAKCCGRFQLLMATDAINRLRNGHRSVWFHWIKDLPRTHLDLDLNLDFVWFDFDKEGLVV